MPLHPTEYGEMLSSKMKDAKVNVWLINTGWTGGSYGTGTRMELKYTRAMIDAAMEGKLQDISFTKHPIFGLEMPTYCENVPAGILNPRDTWEDKEAYDTTARQLAMSFNNNFNVFKKNASEEIISGGPLV